MKPLLNMSLRRGVVLLAFAFCVVVGGTSAVVKVATEHLLYRDATSTARNWARLLAESVNDLEQIAAGEQPSNASMTFFQWAQKAGQVFRYEIYNREGYSQLVSEYGVKQVDLSKFSADAVRSLATNTPIVDVREGASPDRPSFFAQAYVPVLVNGNAVAIVAAYVDQTRLCAAITAPMRFKDHEIMTTASVGVATAPADGNSPERLLKCADLALYASKADGRNCIRFFLPEMDAELQSRIELECIIRDAVLHDRFELHYQPLFEMAERRLIGFEALYACPKRTDRSSRR